MNHPFLLPHRKADEFPKASRPEKDSDVLHTPMRDELELVQTDGPLSVVLARLYVDGIDPDGKPRNVATTTRCLLIIGPQTCRPIS